MKKRGLYKGCKRDWRDDLWGGLDFNNKFMLYSNSEINKAGEILKQKIISSEDEHYARNILENFRWVHIEALRTFRILLIRKIKSFPNILLSQRLKRTPSIVNKLKINKSMSLSRMQDVWWLRIVSDNIDEIYKIKELIRKSELQPNFKSRFHSEKDYIINPKESWYRWIHLVYKFNNKCFIEIQIRNKIQHAWATAVEIVGLYLNQPLKQSFWEDKWLELFKKISKCFSLLEKWEKDDVLFNLVLNDIKENKLLDKIKSFRIATHLINNQEKNKWKYFLIQLNFEKKALHLERFIPSELDKANTRYSQLESENKDNNNIQVVLVSVDDVNKLEKLYPNYFLDTKEFLYYIDSMKK